MDLNQKRVMPDVAQSQTSHFASQLQWVGMEKVALPLQIAQDQTVQAEADIFVNLTKKEAKGIHMSRLYLAIQEGLAKKTLNTQTVSELLQMFIDSQKGLANASSLILRWSEIHERKALLSEFSGWKTYPVEIHAQKVNGQVDIDFKFSFYYSSTCPCSSALSRQLYQQAFAKEFCDDNISFDKIFQWLGESQISNPHSQRSRADVTLKMKAGETSLDLLPYLDALEDALKTPVQTAVKREDEQEFARLNGENPMFVEDALRTMKQALSEFSSLQSFVVKTHHFESLHAHDAVGQITSLD